MTGPPHSFCRFLFISFFALALIAWGQEGNKYEELENQLASVGPKDKLPILMKLINLDLFPGQNVGKSMRYARMALELAKERKDARAEGLAYKIIAYCHFKTGAIQDSLRFYFQAREIFSTNGLWNMIGVINFEIGNLFHYCWSDYVRALDYYKKSLLFCERTGDIYGQVKDINIMGEVYRKMGRYEEAVSAYIRALKKSEAADSYLIRRKRAIILVNLCDMYMLLEDYSQARVNLEKAELVYRRENMIQEIGGVYSRKGDIFKREGRYAEALHWYDLALKIREQGYDPQYTAMEIHKIAEAQSMAGDYSNATRQFNRVLQMRKELSDFPGMAQTLLAMGIHCKRMHRFEDAFPYFQQSLEIANQKGLFLELQEAYLGMAEFAAWKNDRGRELQYRKMHEDIRKRIQSPKISAMVMKLLMEYEREEAVEKVTKKKRRAMMVALASSLLLAVAFFSFIHLARKIKKRAKKDIQSKEEQLADQRSQLDLIKARLRELETGPGRVKYHGSKLTTDLEQAYLKKLIEAMEVEKMYLDADLTLGKLAQRFNVNRSYLSQTINHSTGKTFSDFINSFRIDAAKAMIRSMEENSISMLDICLDSGFNSKTVFNRIFKKFTGKTPLEYRKEVIGEMPRGNTNQSQ